MNITKFTNIHIRKFTGRLAFFAFQIAIFASFVFFVESMLQSAFSSSRGVPVSLPISIPKKNIWQNQFSPSSSTFRQIIANESSSEIRMDSAIRAMLENACIEGFRNDQPFRIVERTKIFKDSAWISYDILPNTKNDAITACKHASISQLIPTKWPLDSNPVFDVFLYTTPKECGCGDTTKLFYTPFMKIGLIFDQNNVIIINTNRMIFRPTQGDYYYPFVDTKGDFSSFLLMKELAINRNLSKIDSLSIRRSYKKGCEDLSISSTSERKLSNEFWSWVGC